MEQVKVTEQDYMLRFLKKLNTKLVTTTTARKIRLNSTKTKQPKQSQ